MRGDMVRVPLGRDLHSQEVTDNSRDFVSEAQQRLGGTAGIGKIMQRLLRSGRF